MTSTDDVRKLAFVVRTCPLLRKVGTFPNVVLVAINPLGTVTENSKIATNAISRPDMNVREKTRCAIFASSVIRKVNAQRCALRCRFV